MKFYLQYIIVLLFVLGKKQRIHSYSNEDMELLNNNDIFSNQLDGQIKIDNETRDTTDIPDITDRQTWREPADILCPYYRLCSNSSTDSVPSLSGTNGSCCLQRKCSNVCSGSYYGDSNECVDMSSHCKSQAELYNITKGLQHAESVYYHVIDTCMDSFNHTETVQACRYPKVLLDVVLVIDDDNNIYKNDKCAQCNNINEYTYWELVVNANETFTDLNFDKIPERVIAEGKWYSRAPDNIENYRVVTNRCFPEAVSTCNETGLWDRYDSDLETACKTSGPTYYEGIFVWFPVIYKNVFCFLCNQRTSTAAQKGKQCQNDPNLFSSHGSRLTFEIVLDVVRIYTLLHKKETLAVCGINEVWDKNMMTCRVFTCPLGSTEVFGQCNTDVLYTEGRPLKFTIALEPSTSISYKYKGRQFFSELYNMVINELHLDFHGTRCTIHELEFYRHNKTVDIFLELTVVTDFGCKESDISSTVFRLLDRKDVTVKFRYDFQTIQYKVNLIFDYLNHTHRESMLYRKKDVRCCLNAQGFYLHPRFYCPSIQLNNTDMEKIEEMFGTNIKDDIYQRSDKGNENRILYDGESYIDKNSSSPYVTRICLNEYLTAFPETSEQGMFSPGTRHEPNIVINAVLLCFSGLFYLTFM